MTKSKLLKKNIEFSGKSYTLFSIDGFTWSTNPEELEKIIERQRLAQESVKETLKGGGAVALNSRNSSKIDSIEDSKNTKLNAEQLITFKTPMSSISNNLQNSTKINKVSIKEKRFISKEVPLKASKKNTKVLKNKIIDKTTSIKNGNNAKNETVIANKRISTKATKTKTNLNQKRKKLVSER